MRNAFKNNFKLKYPNAFFSVTDLTLFDAFNLEFLLDIFFRYTVVLQIFKDHARTKEAKLQVALAEIPYMRLVSC